MGQIKTLYQQRSHEIENLAKHFNEDNQLKCKLQVQLNQSITFQPYESNKLQGWVEQQNYAIFLKIDIQSQKIKIYKPVQLISQTQGAQIKTTRFNQNFSILLQVQHFYINDPIFRSHLRARSSYDKCELGQNRGEITDIEEHSPHLSLIYVNGVLLVLTTPLDNLIDFLDVKNTEFRTMNYDGAVFTITELQQLKPDQICQRLLTVENFLITVRDNELIIYKAQLQAEFNIKEVALVSEPREDQKYKFSIRKLSDQKCFTSCEFYENDNEFNTRLDNKVIFSVRSQLAAAYWVNLHKSIIKGNNHSIFVADHLLSQSTSANDLHNIFLEDSFEPGFKIDESRNKKIKIPQKLITDVDEIVECDITQPLFQKQLVGLNSQEITWVNESTILVQIIVALLIYEDINFIVTHQESDHHKPFALNINKSNLSRRNLI